MKKAETSRMKMTTEELRVFKENIVPFLDEKEKLMSLCLRNTVVFVS